MVGKQYKYKLLESAVPRTVVDVRNGFVIFDDGSRIEEKRLSGLFEEYSGVIQSNGLTAFPDLESNSTQRSQSSGNSPQDIVNADVVDPSTFFDDSKIISNISTQAKNINTAQMASYGDAPTGARVVESSMAQDVNTPQDQIKQVAVQRDDYTPLDQVKAGYQAQYTSDGRPINPGMETPNAPSVNESAGFSMLKQMKRNKSIKLNLALEENIPNPEFIKMMDENFNSGVIDYLVTDIVNELLKHPQVLEKQIKESIEELVYGKKKRVTKPRKKTQTTTSTNKKTQTRQTASNKPQTRQTRSKKTNEDKKIDNTDQISTKVEKSE